MSAPQEESRTPAGRRAQPGDRPAVVRRCPCCGGEDFVVHFTYDRPAAGEMQFRFAQGQDYWREIHRCRGCGHFLDWHEMDQTQLYSGDYVSTTYGDLDGLRRNFERILSLPAGQSDNARRVKAILDFAGRHFAALRFTRKRPTLLDVGSGLCVFANRMQAAGWDAMVIDLDERQIQHARETAGVPGIVADVTSVTGIGPFELVSFNKVLEHVEDPVHMLESVRRLLAGGGVVYVEVPDGETASREGKTRQEFFLGHRHVFSSESLERMVRRSGFDAIEADRLHEPSGKYTLRVFAAPANQS